MVDFYILNQDTYKPQDIIEGYNSVIWTERYNDTGDVTIVAPISHPVLSNLSIINSYQDYSNPLITYVYPKTVLVGKQDSRYFMILDTIERDYKTGTIKLSGLTADSILKYRKSIAYERIHEGREWRLHQTVAEDAKTVVRWSIDSDFVEDATLGIQNLAVTNDTHTAGDTTGRVIPEGSTFDALKGLMDSIDAGWRFMRQYDTSNLNFNLYKGIDRPNVIFSPENGTLNDAKIIESIEGAYTSISRIWYQDEVTGTSFWNPGFPGDYVYPVGDVFARRDDPEVRKMPEGWFKDLSDYERTQTIKNMGKEIYAAHLPKRLATGTVSKKASGYVYGKDYFLGDIVRLSINGVETKQRVREHIYSVDSNGIQEYPTLGEVSSTAE